MFRTIIHLDADAFFASVEQAADPRLRGKAVAVGGEKRGIIASASYEARKLGIYTPMPTSRARKICPKLIIVPGDFEKYEQFSRWMFSYAYDFTPDVEISSIDEGYFDLSGVRKSPVQVADIIRTAIGQSLKISVSEGIGSNKLISQIASKLNKPAAFVQIEPGKEIPFLHPLANKWLPGVGEVTAGRLNAAGLARIGQISATPCEMLEMLVGSQALGLKRFADGIDDRPVVPESAPAKSYSEQETFPADITDETYAEAVLQRMTDALMAKVRAERKCIRTVTVKIRYNDMDEAQCGESLLEPTDIESEVYSRLPSMLRRAWSRRVSLRMVSLKFSNIYEGNARSELELEASGRNLEARRRLAGAVDELRDKMGRSVIMRGHDFRLKEPPKTDVEAAEKSRLEIGAPLSGMMAESNLRKGKVRAAQQRSPTKLLEIKPKLQCIPLNLHSHYSFLNSTLSVSELVGWAKSQGLPALALTDQGNLHGAVEFCIRAKEAGIRPIVGAEIRVQGSPVCLYVQDQRGYRNLCQLLSMASRRAEDGAVGEMGSMGGINLRLNHFDGLTEGLIAIGNDSCLKDLFLGRFYRAVDSLETARKTEGAGVLFLPVHYGSAADRIKFDIVQSIRTRTLLRQPHPEKIQGGEFHLRDREALPEWCFQFPKLLSATEEIAGQCDFSLSTAKPQFPKFPTPEGISAGEYLSQLAMEGLRARYGDRAGQFRGQVMEELAIIREVGYEDYFLVVWDILRECRRRGIEWITRGSAADSMVCYCLGISGVCPVRFDLYFRRFLNKERMALNKLPDVDLDFAHDRKDDVIDLIFEKYGRDHCAVVGGFSTYQARGAVADVAKVLGVSEHQVRRFTESFPWTGARGLLPLLQEKVECRDLPLLEEPYKTAVEMAEFLDGVPRYAKMHPCGVVLSCQPMGELTPTFLSNMGYPTTHFDMDAVEMIGLVKMDILAQGGLAVLRDVKAVLKARGVAVDCELPFLAEVGAVDLKSPISNLKSVQDPAVWEMIASGGARAVHHIESPAMLSLCRMTNVREIDGLIAIVSVIRPGAANEDKKKQFTRRYQGLEPVVFPHPSLEPCLRSTFGLVVYEEHILQICEAFAGLSAGRADVLRRALVKQKRKTVLEIREEFIQAARARGHDEATILEVWKMVEGFSGYAFCRAHSTAYGVEAYEAAWLKYYYPAEFMAAVLSNGKGFYPALVYVLECHRLGIKLASPSIQEPGPGFIALGNTDGLTVGRASSRAGLCMDSHHGLSGASPHRGDGFNVIRVPATSVKGLTHQTASRMVAEARLAKFSTFGDFFRRVSPSREEMEALIRAGAFDVFGEPRTRQFWECQSLFRSYCDAEEPGQGWLLPPPELDRLPTVALQEANRRQRLEWEQELFGFPVSGHPLELYENIAWDTYCPISRLGEFVGQVVITCGLVIEQRTHHQVTGEPMKFLSLADKTGMIETEMFAKTYRSYGLAAVRYPVLEIEASVESYENGRGFSLRILRAGKPRSR